MHECRLFVGNEGNLSALLVSTARRGGRREDSPSKSTARVMAALTIATEASSFSAAPQLSIAATEAMRESARTQSSAPAPASERKYALECWRQIARCQTASVVESSASPFTKQLL